MKIIFDIGCNEGQNLEYFLKKADYVVGIEANPFLIKNIKKKFQKDLRKKKLFLENIALSNKISSTIFYINKKKNYLSQLEKPKNISEFRKINIETKLTSQIIKKYLKKLKLKNIEFIKIDVETSSEKVFEDLLNNKVIPKFLTIEAQSPKVLELILKSPYKSFKFLNGKDIGTKLKKLKILDKKNEKIQFNFKIHSAGPYGTDIPGRYYDKTSLVNFFINNGFGWKDVNCYINHSAKYDEIEYNTDIHNQGYRYHLKKLITKFIRVFVDKFIKYEQ